jgi:hypothetical protein
MHWSYTSSKLRLSADLDSAWVASPMQAARSILPCCTWVGSLGAKPKAGSRGVLAQLGSSSARIRGRKRAMRALYTIILPGDIGPYRPTGILIVIRRGVRTPIGVVNPLIFLSAAGSNLGAYLHAQLLVDSPASCRRSSWCGDRRVHRRIAPNYWKELVSRYDPRKNAVARSIPNVDSGNYEFVAANPRVQCD